MIRDEWGNLKFYKRKGHMKIEVYRKNLFYRVKIVGANGEPMLVSETYYNRGNAIRAARILSKATKIKLGE